MQATVLGVAEGRTRLSDFTITYVGRESKKAMAMCVCITDSLSCIPEANTML